MGLTCDIDFQWVEVFPVTAWLSQSCCFLEGGEWPLVGNWNSFFFFTWMLSSVRNSLLGSLHLTVYLICGDLSISSPQMLLQDSCNNKLITFGSGCYVPRPGLNMLPILMILTATIWGDYYYHFNYKWGDRDIEMLTNLSKFSIPVSDEAGT